MVLNLTFRAVRYSAYAHYNITKQLCFNVVEVIEIRLLPTSKQYHTNVDGHNLNNKNLNVKLQKFIVQEGETVLKNQPMLSIVKRLGWYVSFK